MKCARYKRRYASRSVQPVINTPESEIIYRISPREHDRLD